MLDEFKQLHTKGEGHSTFKNSNEFNVKRMVQVNNIAKRRFNFADPNIHITSKELKTQRNISRNNTALILKRSGVPSFLKTKFKSETLTKYHGVNGHFFGC